MAALLESDTKSLLRRHGIAVPCGMVCASPSDVANAFDELKTPVAVKALVPSKGKQLAGGIHFAESRAEAVQIATRLFGVSIAGFKVREVLVEMREHLSRQIYACVELDFGTSSYRLTVAANGGADVEHELARGGSRSLQFYPGALPWDYQVRDLLIDCGLQGEVLRHTPKVIVSICRAALAADTTLLEINPLGILADGTPCAIGVLASVDESAVYRQPDLAPRAVLHVDQLLRPLTVWEAEVDALNRSIPDGGDIRFSEFPDGDIGMMVLGGGAGLMGLDAVARAGGKPANFLDMTSAAGQAEEKLYRVTKLFLAIERLRGLFIGSNIGAFLPVPIRMRGIARAIREDLSSKGRFPIVIRLAGIGDDEVAPIIEDLRITYFRDEVTLEDAIEVFMRQVEATA